MSRFFARIVGYFRPARARVAQSLSDSDQQLLDFLSAQPGSADFRAAEESSCLQRSLKT
jgi:hypothetical protein